MNLKSATILLSIQKPLLALASGNEGNFKPHRITHERLTADPLYTANESIIIDTLAKEGIVSITGIPGFGQTKRNLMTYLHSCILDQGYDTAPQETFKDGTVRRTLGTVTLPGTGAQPIELDDELSESCQMFNKNLSSFRAAVDQTTAAFAERLTFEMGSSLEVPIMTTQDGSHDFDTIKDIVASGDHLEHFHSYQKTKESVGASSLSTGSQTIDLHTDQGFFIALSPALIVAHKGDKKTPDLSQPLVESKGFYILTSDGKRALVNVDSTDDLIFMLGDGVNQ